MAWPQASAAGSASAAGAAGPLGLRRGWGTDEGGRQPQEDGRRGLRRPEPCVHVPARAASETFTHRGVDAYPDDLTLLWKTRGRSLTALCTAVRQASKVAAIERDKNQVP